MRMTQRDSYLPPRTAFLSLPLGLNLLVAFSTDGELDDFNAGHFFIPDGDPQAYDPDDLADERF